MIKVAREKTTGVTGFSITLLMDACTNCISLRDRPGYMCVSVCPGCWEGCLIRWFDKYILYPQIRVQRMMEIQKRGEEDILGHWLVVNQRYYHHRQALMTGPLPPPECAHVFRGKKRNGGFTAVEHEEHLCGTHLCSLLQGLRFTKRLLQTKEKTFSVKDQ